MPRKKKTSSDPAERPLSPVASMNFWSRLKNPPPVLAFAFPELPDSEPASLDHLLRLPVVPVDDSAVYSVRIVLDCSSPLIWRRVQLKSQNLEILHQIIQLAMGWLDSHLHCFEIGTTIVPMVEDGAAINERAISIAQLHAAKISQIQYTYDLGDDWRHTLTIEDVSAAQPQSLYPQCLEGEGACPLEDIGGINRWSQLLRSMQHPEIERDQDLKELIDRLGYDFVARKFNLMNTTKRLQKAFKRPPGRKKLS